MRKVDRTLCTHCQHYNDESGKCVNTYCWGGGFVIRGEN